MTPTPTPAQQDDLEQLEGFLQTLGGGSLVFCLYSSLDDVDYVQNALKDKLEKPLERRVLNAEQPNPLRQLRELPPEPARVVFMVYLGNLEDDLKLTAGYANVQREVLNEINHTLVLWFGEESFARFVKAAPDFWAWHSGGVFEFQGIAGRKPLGEMLQTTEASLPKQQLIDLEGLKRRAESYKAILESYPTPTKEDLPYLARTYIRYASVLEDLTDYAEALEQIKKAIDIAEDDLQNNELLAEAVNLESIIHSKMGNREAALEASQEALEIRRKLAQTNPDAFLPNVATSLNNLGAMLSDLGRRAEALKASQESVQLYRLLSARVPHAFNLNYAVAANTLSNRLEETGNILEAAKLAEEAVLVLEPVFLAYPDAVMNRMQYMVEDYQNRSQAAGLEIDQGLLGRIVPKLS